MVLYLKQLPLTKENNWSFWVIIRIEVKIGKNVETFCLTALADSLAVFWSEIEMFGNFLNIFVSFNCLVQIYFTVFQQ